ncbi:site-2 protease family protein [Archaeoglobus veneficus]|uniref:Peptidase M50 n=1 Tax=Archaeoglobus veneficus (strain DSM 11195 / SNP6) TaxID=693661 RepID=F2KQH9_ARCVS|nr:site-2 protease family protein [Archaeoglobus veneficus]AEA47712.1 peptidase M50 [Archaeoglobus veneficus SNP6]
MTDATREIEEIKKEIERNFYVYDVREIPGGLRFYVLPEDSGDIQSQIALARIAAMARNYDVSAGWHLGEAVIEIKRRKERIWINIVLLIATFISTTLIGSTFYENFDIAGGVVFSLSVLFVLGSHEMGHYFAAKRWGLKTSLPYFIPFPTIIGTLGAVIKHRGPIPNRRALFDVGVSGPLVGIVAAIIVTFIGLNLKHTPPSAGGYEIGIPPLFYLITMATGFEGGYIHPVAFAGWVGMFITALNMLPVGQLDGGHVLRAMIGKKSEMVSKIVPICLIILGYVVEINMGTGSGSIWVLWGLITLFFSMHPHPSPIDDETPLDRKRVVLGIVAFVIAALCFTPAPILAIR